MSTLTPEDVNDPLEETFRSLEVVARSMHVKDAKLQPTLDAIVTSAIDAMPAARHAGLILVIGGRLIPQSTVGRPPLVLDLLQQQLGVGPCFDAAASQTANRIADTAMEERWPEFAAEAVKLGVASVVCVPLWVNDRMLGALSLYADVPLAFSDHDERTTSLFGALAAVALDGATRQEQMLAALRGRDVIGQAKGILMERHKITPDAAFAQLTITSQNQNRKLIDVATHLVDTGELLGS